MAWCWHSSKLWQTPSGEFMLDLKINKLGQWEGSSIKFQRHLTWKSETLHLGWGWRKHCLISTLPNLNLWNPAFARDVFLEPVATWLNLFISVPKKAVSSLKASSRFMVSISASAINKPYNLRLISRLSWALGFLSYKMTLLNF